MNWLELLLKAVSIAPTLVEAVEKLHVESATATKTQMAQDALSVATAGADALLPAGQQSTINGVSSGVGQVIASLSAN